jgi:hypothetical protein
MHPITLDQQPAIDPSPTVEPPLHSGSGTPVPAAIVLNLADVAPFTAYTIVKPNVPVLAAFGGERLHACQILGHWDLEKAVAEAPAPLFRSVRFVDAEKDLKRWDDLTFCFGPRSFVVIDDIRLAAYADTAVGALHLAEGFARKYAKPTPREWGRFYLIRTGNEEITTEAVPLSADTLLAPEVLALHYGEEGSAWHLSFREKLCIGRRGLCILEGSPGTGKTSYLRHLMGDLRQTHRFYFIPPASLDVLSNPNFIGFWAAERRRYGGAQFVVVLEDADAALMSRATDNLSQVGAILNLSDGMLGDFLRLQIICTINCRAEDIDQALLRPGRLLCHRVFGRMGSDRACRLAHHLGKKLSAARDYSLAEIFADDGIHWDAAQPRIGFAA